MVTRVLVPLDGSATAEAVIPEIEKLAENCEAEIVLLKVIPPVATREPNGLTNLGAPDFTLLKMIPQVVPPSTGGSDEIMYMDALVARETGTARDYLEEIAADLTRRGMNARVETRCGGVVEQIVKLAQEERVDLITMTTRARVGPSRLLRGSIAEKVMHKSRVPVVLVKPTPAALAKRRLQKLALGVAK